MDTWLKQDFDSQHDKDCIFTLERQKDLEATWQKEEHFKPIKITYEDIPRNKSFRRFTKKIIFLRSHFPTEDDRTETGCIGSLQGEYEDIRIISGPVTQGTDY